jgi:hypothetical protein
MANFACPISRACNVISSVTHAFGKKWFSPRRDMDDLLRTSADRAEMLIEERSPSTNATVVCLNFKVPLRIRQQFKIYAARRNCTMTELLMQFLNEIQISEVSVAPTNVIQQPMQK